MSRKTIICPKCGAEVRLPFLWIVGVEIVFRCGECKRPFKTGFKMGALLLGLSLALAVGCANILSYLFSSATIPLAVILIVPMWLLFGFMSRKAYLIYKIRRQQKRAIRNSGES